jgi:hypothetical protein
VALAQLCINKAASDGTSPGHHHASAAFVFISVAISIAQKQKLKAIEEPQISKNIEIEYSCFSDMSNVGKFHDAIAKIDKSSPCRFVSSWLLANGGQFFNLFRLQKDLLSSLVPLNEEQLLRDCVVFVQREAYQQYIPSACFSWLSAHTRTFSKVFVSIFSTQGALVSRIPQCISPFPPPFCPNIEGHLVCDLFSVDEVQQKAAGSIISNIICSDPAAHMHLVGSILLRIKNGDTLSGSRVAIQAILPVMEHPGLHGDRTAEGGIQGGWHSRDEFFMTLLHGRSLYPKDKTAFLNSLSVHDLLEQSSSPNASKVSLINTIFADLILFSRGISASQSMWRLENPDKAGMISLFFPSARHQSNDDVVDKLVRVFDLLNEVYKCDNFESLLLFSPPEMIGIAAALLSARNFALRRPLFDVYKFLSCLKPHIARVEKHDPAAAEAVAKSIFSFISPEFYVASLNNAKCFQKLCALVKWSDSTTVGLLDIMNAFVSDSFCSTLRALKELSQSSIEVGGQVGSHVIFLYFDCLQSMFSYCASTFDTLQLLERSNKARDAMASLDASRRHASFVCEVWPEPVLQSATFSATDIVSVLKIISTTKNFEFVWAIAKDIHNCLLFKVDLSRRCRLLRPMHRVIAHAISFLAQTCVTFMSLPDESYKSQKSDAFTQLVELCNVVVPSDFHEGNWLMALPVVREIFSQQTSFLSSASSMFLGVPVLVEGHLFDATHTPWVLGKVKEQAGSIANGCYYDHPLFVECDHQTYDKTSMYSPVDCFSATRSIFICMAFDFLGTRSSFLSWLHKVVSCDLSQYASDAVSEFKFCEKWCAWGAGVDPQFKFLNYFKNAQTDESKRKIRQGNAFLQKVFTAVPGSEEFFLEAGWSLQLAEPLAGRIENIYEFKGHEERLRSACAILTPPFHLTPHFHEAQFHGAVAADILALLPTFKRNDAMTSSLWENIHALGRLEYEEFFKLDQRGRGLFMMSFATSCLEVQSLFRTCRLSTQQQKYLQPLTDLQKLQEEDKAHLSDREISNIFQSFSEILLDADGSSRLSAHARCLMSGSFFRVSACGIIFRIPYIQVESRALVNLCQSFCLWFANLEAAKSDTFADEIKRNTFSSITAIGQETIRAAVHCLLLLPDASVNVPVALAHLSPVLTESHPNLIEIAVSTLTKSSIFHRSASDLGAEKVLQIVSSILFNQLDAKTSAFQVVLGRPSLFLKLCDWLMMNHHDYHCGHLLIRLISEQNFPKVCDVLPPRSCMTGLVNVGNTCFIASLYQQLASIPSFVAALQSCTFGPEGARLVLTQQSKTVVFRELLGKIMNQRQCLNSDVVEGFFRKLGFSLDRQQDDPLSVLSSMVSWIVAETSDYDRHKHGDETKMKQTALDSPVLFHTIVSQMRKHVSWQDCTCSSQCTEIESFFDGTITLIEDKKHPTGCQSMKSIEEVLRARLNERTTEDQCSCRSGQSKCKISLEFEKLPQVLIVGLNARVEFVGSQLSPLKDNRVPSISSELDISKCAKLSSSAAEGNTVYTLNGIILHHGSSVSSGHYTSLIRRSDSEWIHLDDNLASAVDASDMKSVLHRGGKELPRVDYACPTHLTGKPCVLFYVRKTVSHPCSSVLFDSRLVEKTLVTTVQSPILESAIARDTISLCFRLAPLFARENDRLRSIASIANQLLLPEYEEYFLQLASSDDPELFLAMCRNRSTSSDFHGCYFKEVALKLTDVAPHFSSRAVHRRLASCFEIALQLPSDLHAQIVDKICSFGIASESLLTGAERQPLSTKCYAVLKSISDLPDDSPFIRHFSEHERFALAVSALDNSMCSATSDQETNLCVQCSLSCFLNYVATKKHVIIWVEVLRFLITMFHAQLVANDLPQGGR